MEPASSTVKMVLRLSVFFFGPWLEQLHALTSQLSGSWPLSLKMYLQGGEELRRGCKERSSAGLYKKDHNWQMHILHHLGTVPCTLCCSIRTSPYQSVNWLYVGLQMKVSQQNHMNECSDGHTKDDTCPKNKHVISLKGPRLPLGLRVLPQIPHYQNKCDFLP